MISSNPGAFSSFLFILIVLSCLIHRTTAFNYAKSEVFLYNIATKRVPVIGSERRAQGAEHRAESAGLRAHGAGENV